MNLGELEIRVWYHEIGQPRPYADSVYTATVKAVKKTGDREIEIGKKLLLEIIRLLVHDFKEKEHALDPHIESLQKVGFGTWKVRIVEPFCD